MNAPNARLAIIGCGAIIEHHILPALRRIQWLPQVLVDPSSERRKIVLRGVGRRTGIVDVADWEAVQDQFDAAIIAAPHALHAPLGVGLLRAGKHVFTEKPLATTAADCDAMVAEAEASGRILSVGLLRRYLHVARWTKALLSSGLLGDIRSFDVREGFIYNWATSSDAMLRPELAGGGVLMDTGAHTLDLLGWWLGPLEPVGYRDDSVGGVEADCELMCRGGAAAGKVELSRTRNLRNTARIRGTNGFVEIHLHKNQVVDGSPNALAFSHDGIEPSQMPTQLFLDLFDAELADFKNSTKSNVQYGIAANEAAASVKLIEEAYKIRRPLELAWVGGGTRAELAPSQASVSQLSTGSTVVVTGATGFIGGRLVERLVKEQRVRVRCMVRNIGQATRLARLPVEVIRADLTDKSAVDRAVEGSEYIFHCAYDPRSVRQNLDGTRNLIDAAVSQDVRRFVHVSTFSVYEPFPEGELTEDTREGDRSWIYAKTKLELEQAVLEATRSKGLKGTVVQPSIVYGPFSKPWTDGPAQMLLRGRVILPEPGDGLCNCVYIDDLVDGLLLAAIAPEAVGERFLMSGPEPVTWAVFFEEFTRALRTAPPEFWPAADISKQNHGLMRDVKLVLSDPKKIIQIMVRWQPARRALQSGLESLPKSLFDWVVRSYYRESESACGEVKLPDPQLLALYRSKAFASSRKAERLLGYKPAYDFTAGMAKTRPYLVWAFGDVQRSLAPREAEALEAQLGSSEVASVG